MKGVGAAESMMANMMPRINAVAEAYPELKADSSFLNIQNELVSIENQVADRREMYNSAATNFNKAIQMIPTTFVALFGSSGLGLRLAKWCSTRKIVP